ncbi:MAG TPA: isochorismatase family protein [Acidimicrobiales bacterium]|nr:isochorismatase family protein [Acidimicrobiales bacterium]
MSAPKKPWESVIPQEDLVAVGAAYDQPDRPLSAGTRPALLVVDMTREFVDSTYPTGFSQTGRPAVQAIRTLLDVARGRSVPVFFTKNWPDPDTEPSAMERGRWRTGGRRPLPENVPPGDCVVEELSPLPGELVIVKGGKPSAFFGTRLVSYLVYAGCDTVVVTGMTTSGCVRATVVDAFQYNFHCVVPAECTADRSQISHKVSLFDLHMKYADVISLQETIAYLDAVHID